MKVLRFSIFSFHCWNSPHSTHPWDKMFPRERWLAPDSVRMMDILYVFSRSVTTPRSWWLLLFNQYLCSTFNAMSCPEVSSGSPGQEVQEHHQPEHWRTLEGTDHPLAGKSTPAFQARLQYVSCEGFASSSDNAFCLWAVGLLGSSCLIESPHSFSLTSHLDALLYPCAQAKVAFSTPQSFKYLPAILVLLLPPACSPHKVTEALPLTVVQIAWFLDPSLLWPFSSNVFWFVSVFPYCSRGVLSTAEWASPLLPQAAG